MAYLRQQVFLVRSRISRRRQLYRDHSIAQRLAMGLHKVKHVVLVRRTADRLGAAPG